jgi:hypothetical protein
MSGIGVLYLEGAKRMFVSRIGRNSSISAAKLPNVHDNNVHFKWSCGTP